MDYSVIASSIKEKANSMDSATNNMNSSSFDSIWKGSAHDNLISDLKNSLKKVKEQKESAHKFAEALELIEDYKNNEIQITKLYDSLKLIVDNETNKQANIVKRRRIGTRIEYYKGLNIKLKSSINEKLNGITSVNSELSVVNYDPSSDSEYKEYIVDLQDLASLFKNGNLKTFGTAANTSTFYDYYSDEEINYRLEEIKSQYKGRDAAVNCALGVMEMAAKVGGKLNLGWGTPSSTQNEVIIGNEYSSFASWAVNQGCNGDISAAKIVNSSENTTYEHAQKGDVLVSNSGDLVIIVDNNTENQEFLVAEVSNAEDGVVVQSKSYASLTGNYQAMDLSSIYND